MSEAQGAQAEVTEQGVEPEAVVETQEGQDAEEQVNDNEEVGEQPEESQEPEETVEERLKRLEEDTVDKKKTIDRKTAALSDANKKIRELNEKVQELSSKMEAPKSEPPPEMDDFDSYDDYVEALADYKAEAKVKEERQKMLMQEQQQKIMQMQQERASVARQHEAEYLEVNPNYESSKREFENFIQGAEVSPAVENAIVEQAFEGNVAQVIDYFGANHGENLDKLAEIAKMSPTKAAVEIYKIQQSLGEPSKKEVKPAPAPEKKLPKSDAKSTGKVVDMDEKQFDKWLNG